MTRKCDSLIQSPPPRSGGGLRWGSLHNSMQRGCPRDPHLTSPTAWATAFKQVCESHQRLDGEWDRRRASFDKIRMRVFLCATKIFPHPELVEGRRTVLQRCVNPIAAWGRDDHSDEGSVPVFRGSGS